MAGLFDCVICHDLLEDEKLGNTCGHVFCKQCIEDYLKYSECHNNGQRSSCPVCRKDLNNSTLKPPSREYDIVYRMSKVMASSESLVSETIADSNPDINNLYVRTLTGKTINIHPKSGTKSTIAAVKELIEYYEEIKPNEQLLVYCGKNLKCDKTLEYYKIADGATIQLLGRLKGGGVAQ